MFNVRRECDARASASSWGTPGVTVTVLFFKRTRIERIAREEKARDRRHRAATRQILQDRRCVLDAHSGAFRSRNRRRRARAADQEDRVLRGGVRACSHELRRLRTVTVIPLEPYRRWEIRMDDRWRFSMATHFNRARLTRSVAGAFTAMVFCTTAAFLVAHHLAR